MRSMERAVLSLLLLSLGCVSGQTYGIVDSPSPPCWQKPINITCANPLDAGLSGNLAFPGTLDLPLQHKGPEIADYFSAYGAGFEAKDPTSYHMSISYMFCVEARFQDAFEDSLKSFEWNAITLRLNRICCEDAAVEVCADAAGQAKMANFTARVYQHAIASGVVIPDFFAAQPPYHVTLGLFNSTYNITGAFLGNVPPMDLTVSFDVFYFGIKPYFSKDYLKGGGTSTYVWVLVALLGGLLLTFLILLCTSCGRHCLKKCCPACCCPSSCCADW